MKYQKGVAIPWHLVAMVGIIISLMVSTALYRSWYQAEEQKFERVNTTFTIFKEQTDHAQKAFRTAHKMASDRAAKAEGKWRKYYATKTKSISAKYAAAKRLRDERAKSVRSDGHDLPKEPDNLERVNCGAGGKFAANQRRYRERIFGGYDDFTREIQSHSNKRGDRVRRELAQTRDELIAECNAIKGNIAEILLIEGN